MLKAKGLLPKDFTNRTSVQGKKNFETAIFTCLGDTALRIGLTSQILSGAKKFVHEQTAHHTAVSVNCLADRVALMAHTIVHPDAQPILDAIHSTVAQEDRPAFLDQTVGPAGNASILWGQLLSLAMAIKDDLDESMFSSDHIGI